jgi:hypothetical protein
MAKKVNALKLAQEIRGPSEFTDRLPAPVSPALYLMQLRLPKMRISPTKKRLPVDMDAETRAQVEHPVKIRHVG